MRHLSGYFRAACWGVVVLALGTLALTAGQPGLPGAATPPQTTQQTRPLAFEPNAGQSDAAVRFLVHGPDSTLFFTADGVTLALAPGAARQEAAAARQSANPQIHVAAPPAPTVVRLTFVGANPAPTLLGGNTLTGKVNYLLGNDPAQWHTNLPTYDSVRYSSLYPGIDLTYSGAGGQLKGTYTLAPGTDPALLRWRYTGISGASVDGAGNLQLQTAAGTLTEQAPLAWQSIGGQQVVVPTHYALAADGSVGFALGPYDPARPLTLDPTLTYSTYLGGSAEEQGWGVAVDAAGSAYLTGWTASANFPRQAPYQPTYGGGSYDTYVTKLTPSGSALVYSTYLGGNATDEGMSIAVDGAGNAYVTGRTNSANFPLMNPLQPGCSSCPGALDSFVTKLNPTGSGLVYSTFLGGSASDEANSITVDSSSAAYIAGGTYSSDYPLASPIQPIFGGADDAFLTKVNPAGTALVYSTFLGGSAGDYGWTVAVDGAGEAAVTGLTLSANFPHVNAIQPANAGGGDAFITKLTASGSAYIFSTFFGGTGLDDSEGVAMDATGNVYVGGFTASTNFPTANPYQPSNHGGYDAFVAKLSPSGASLLYSTYLGGGSDDLGYAIAVGGAGEALISGQTNSGNFPTMNAVQPLYGGNGDVFVSKMNAAGSGLGYSTYFGGAGNDYSSRIATDLAGSAYVTGWTSSTDFPTAVPYQPANAGGADAFIFKITDLPPSPTATATSSPSNTPSNTPTNTPSSTPTNAPTNTPTNTPSNTPTAVPPTSTTAATNTPMPSTTCGPVASPTRQATPAFTPAPGCSDTPHSGDLHAVITDHPATTDALFTNHSTTCSYRIGLAIYEKVDGNIDHQVLFDYTLAVVPPNSQMLLTVHNPTCAYQADAFYGDILYSFQGGVRYGVRRLDDSAGNGTNYCRTVCPTPPPATATPAATASPTGVAQPCTVQFSDVDSTQPFYTYIQCLACRGIFNGYSDNTFRPATALTRGQAAKILAGSAGYEDAIPPTQQTFADVSPQQPFWLWIERAAGHGVISGYQCGGSAEPCDSQGRPYYRPGADVTRGQLAKINANAAGYADVIPPTQQSFSDVPASAAFWVYLERMNKHGVISGYTCGQGPSGPCDAQRRAYFLPGNAVTRGQAAKIVANTFFPNCQTRR